MASERVEERQREFRQYKADVKARGKFDQRAFNQELVGHGTVPVKILRAFFRLDR